MTCPLVSLADYLAWAGLTTATADTTALSLVLQEVSDAVCRRLRSPVLQATYTHYLDAPAESDTLYLPQRFVTAIASIYHNPQAFGQPAAFTAEYLLDAASSPPAYYLPFDAPDGSAMSWSGAVVRVGGYWAGFGMWGTNYRRPPRRLTAMPAPGRRDLKVTYTAGFTSTPPAIAAAVKITTSRLMGMRERGYALQSESLNSYSYSGAGGVAADALLGDATTAAMLAPFTPIAVA